MIALGSPYGRDCVAWEVVDFLERDESFCDDVKFIKQSVISPEILNTIKDAKKVIIMDGLIGAAEKTVQTFALDDIERNQMAKYSSHGMSLVEVIRLGEVLDMLPEHLTLVGIGLGENPCKEWGGADFSLVESAAGSVKTILSQMGI